MNKRPWVKEHMPSTIWHYAKNGDGDSWEAKMLCGKTISGMPCVYEHTPFGCDVCQECWRLIPDEKLEIPPKPEPTPTPIQVEESFRFETILLCVIAIQIIGMIWFFI